MSTCLLAQAAEPRQPSELAPAVGALLAQLIPQYLDPEAYAVVLGGIEPTTALLKKQWGHGELKAPRRSGLGGTLILFSVVYTGSGRVGKIVAEAAAKTLTPTTLEVSAVAAPDRERC